MRQHKLSLMVTASLLLALLAVVSACYPVSPAPVSPVTGTPSPEFVVGPLNLTPSTVTVGDSVVVSTIIRNAGDTTGTYSAALLINGQQADSKDIVVGPGGVQGVAFQISETTTGNYNVSIGNSTAVLTVYNWVPYTIQYDNSDGAVAGAYVNGDQGHIVQFTPPNKAFMIQKIRIFAAARITTTSELNNVVTFKIWDKDATNLLWSQDVPWGLFIGDVWQEITVPDIRVNDDFRVEVVTHSYAPGYPIDFVSLIPIFPPPPSLGGGIYRIYWPLIFNVRSAVLIGFDYPFSYIDAPLNRPETRSGYSYMGKLIDTGQKRLEGINWLIRVEGEGASGS
jgi:hypothetical protein